MREGIARTGAAAPRKRGLAKRKIGQCVCTSFGVAASRISRLEPLRGAVPATIRQRFWPRIPLLPQGSGMLIRGENFGFEGGAAPAAPAIPAASLPTNLLGGLLLLICP